jgi:4-amino-4-deoxy-L-arabinose transferase-like glycosyltransferase
MLPASRKALLWLVMAVYCLLVLPRMLSYGMFLDGIVYASIARNMADHHGSFWQPYYTATVAPVFYDHPPLGFWLQSWAYRLCGDVVYVEAFWGFVTGALILMSLGCVWRYHMPQRSALAGTWFPILLFVIIPMTSWILSNNMLENTMTVFIMVSACTCLLSLRSSKKTLSLAYGLLSGFNIFLAFLVKGPVALFAITVPLFSVIKKDEIFTKILLTSLSIIFGFLFSLIFILLSSDDATNFFSQYVNRQIIASIRGVRELARSRFNIFWAVGSNLIVPIIFGGLLATVVYRTKQFKISSINRRLFLFYLCIALSGSLPIYISPKQMRWYAFPSFPFYTLAVAIVFNDVALTLEKLLDKNKHLYRNVLISSAFILSLSIILMILGKSYVGRHKDFHNTFSIRPISFGEREIMSVYPENLTSQWSLVANMQRKFKASLTKDIGHKYLLSTSEYKNSPEISSMYQLLYPENSNKYILFKLND